MVMMMAGDREPKVAVLQILLNRVRKPGTSTSVSGSGFTAREPVFLRVDADFGPKTQAAVIDFQKSLQVKPDGIVDPVTWAALAVDAGLSTLDLQDLGDPRKTVNIALLEAAGCKPIVTGGSSNGLETALLQALQQASKSGPIFVMRFHGHGGPGIIAVSYGNRGTFAQFGMKAPDPKNGMTTLNEQTILAVVPLLCDLRRHFARFGSVELHGCSVAAGQTGMRFLHMLADIVGVPVAASNKRQYSGHSFFYALRFEGRPTVVVPGGRSLASWAQSHEEPWASLVPA